MNPLVSISCITYNHAPYIRQCLDGFMMQQTNFAFEVLIHDDASTDGTTDIIKEYEAKYPDIIKPIYEEENQWVKGRRGSAIFNFPRAKGKYIAMCEGDDYWTDPLKLQRQVDFLETHSDYTLCGHRYKAYVEKDSTFIDFGADIDGTFDLEYMVNHQKFCSTLSVVFRNSAIHINELNRYPYVLDLILFYHLLKSGKGYCMPDIMAVYRMHNGGIWSTLNYDAMAIGDIKHRLIIYKVEKSRQAALFIRTLITKRIGRRWMLRHGGLFLRCMNVIYEQYGLKGLINFIYRYLVLRERY